MNLQKLRRVHAGRAGEGDRLRQYSEKTDDPVVHHQLEPAPRSRLAEPDRLVPNGVEDRLTPLTNLLGTGGENY